mgnify:CR=1 FL=1
MANIKDFLHPLWKLSQDNDRDQVNNAILSSINSELSNVEQDTISAKLEMMLGNANDEWLDFWGSWFGLKRNASDDEAYRQEIINHVKHPRDTIPALREAIARFLNEDVSSVKIYEPWTDIFILNDSNLNSNAHLMGDYYQYGIIDIHVNVPFDSNLIDVINWFRPGGVIWVLTYDPGDSSDAPIWEMSPSEASLEAKLTQFEDLIGVTSHFNRGMSLDYSVTSYNISEFILNYSILNSSDLIMGDDSQNNQYINSFGFLRGRVTPNQTDTDVTFYNKILRVDNSEYSKLSRPDNNYYSINVSPYNKMVNYLSKTQDFSNWGLTAANSVDQSTLDGCSILNITQPNYPLISPNVVSLVKGNKYTVSFYARAVGDLPATSSINVTLGSSLSSKVVASDLTSSFKLYTLNFIYNDSGSTILNINTSFDTAKISQLQIAKVMIRDEEINYPAWNIEIPDWVPNDSDFTYTDTGLTYAYSTFNFRQFFYDQVQSESDVKSAIGGSDDYTVLNSYMNTYLGSKEVSFTYGTDDKTNNSVSTYLMAYNFKLNIWVNLKENMLTGPETINDKVTFNNLDQYLNQNGMLFVAVGVSSLNHDFNLNIDTVRIDISNNVDGNFAMNLYADQDFYNEFFENIITDYIETNDSTEELYGSYQRGYPFRYVRTTMNANTSNKSNGSVVFEDRGSSKAPIVSGSTLNALMLIQDDNALVPNVLGNLNSNINNTYTKSNIWNVSGATTINSISSKGVATFSGDRVLADMNVGSLNSDRSYKVVFHANTSSKNERLYASLKLESNYMTYTIIDKQLLSLTSSDQEFTLNFDTKNFVPSNVIIEIDSLSNSDGQEFVVSAPEVYLNYAAYLDSNAYAGVAPSLVRDYSGNYSYPNPVSFSSGEHTFEVDLGYVTTDVNRILVNHGQFNGSSSAYSWKIQTSIDGTNWHTWFDNYSGDISPKSPLYYETNELYPVILDSYDTIQNRHDMNNDYTASYGYPDSDISWVPTFRYIFDSFNLIFNTDSDFNLDILYSRDNMDYSVYHSVVKGTSVYSPAQINQMDNIGYLKLDNTDIIANASVNDDVYPFFTEYGWIDTQMTNPIVISDGTSFDSDFETDKYSVLDTSNTLNQLVLDKSEISTATQYIEQYIIQFNILKKIQDTYSDVFTDFAPHNVPLQTKLVKQIVGSTAGIVSTLNLNTTNHVVAVWNQANNTWDSISDKATLSNLVNYIDSMGMVDMTIYSLGSINEYPGNLVNISDIDFTFTIDKVNTNNSLISPYPHIPIAKFHGSVAKDIVGKTDTDIYDITIPYSSLGGQISLDYNLFAVNSGGQVGIGSSNASDVLPVTYYNYLNQGRQHQSIIIDTYPYYNKYTQDLQLSLYVNCTNNNKVIITSLSAEKGSENTL